MGLLMFLLVIFSIKSQIIFGLVLEFIFEIKFLQEDPLASLMVYQVLALSCLYFFQFSDEGFI